MGNAPFIERRVAVMVDCDNLNLGVLEYALQVGGKLGQVVLRRGYGNHATLANKWQDALVRLAFTPHLHYQCIAGKNTSDIALALDALEVMVDRRADVFCLVTSDSDFSYLCRKLRERGATVYVVGESKTPEALRNACDTFYAYSPAAAVANAPAQKRSPKFIVDAVTRLAGDSPRSKIGLCALGQELKRTRPEFKPGAYGHASLLKMIGSYDLLEITQEAGGLHMVQLTEREAQ